MSHYEGPLPTPTSTREDLLAIIQRLLACIALALGIRPRRPPGLRAVISVRRVSHRRFAAAPPTSSPGPWTASRPIVQGESHGLPPR